MRKFGIVVNGQVAAILEIEVTGTGQQAVWHYALRAVGQNGVQVELQAYDPGQEVPIVLPSGATTTTWTPPAPYTQTDGLWGDAATDGSVSPTAVDDDPSATGSPTTDGVQTGIVDTRNE